MTTTAGGGVILSQKFVNTNPKNKFMRNEFRKHPAIEASEEDLTIKTPEELEEAKKIAGVMNKEELAEMKKEILMTKEEKAMAKEKEIEKIKNILLKKLDSKKYYHMTLNTGETTYFTFKNYKNAPTEMIVGKNLVFSVWDPSWGSSIMDSEIPLESINEIDEIEIKEKSKKLNEFPKLNHKKIYSKSEINED